MTRTVAFITIAVALACGSRSNRSPAPKGSDLTARFTEGHTPALRSLAAAGEETVAEPAADGSLFSVELRPAAGTRGGRRAVVVTSASQFRERGYRWRQRDGSPELHLEWLGLDVGGEVTAVDVRVRVRASPDRPGIDWRIEVDNRSAVYGIYQVDFPRFRLLPFGGGPDGDRLVVPRGLGKEVDAPFAVGEQLSLSYPAPLSMPWAAVYHPGRGGLYLGAHDSAAGHKSFVFRGAGDRIDFALRHHLADVGRPGGDYAQSYPFVTRRIPGHWYDAAQAYREWALKQRWVTGGPLATRRDAQAWFVNAPLVMRLSTRGPLAASQIESALRFRERLGLEGPTPLIWYLWKEYAVANPYGEERAASHAGRTRPPKLGVAEAVEQLGDAGIRVTPYLNARVIAATGSDDLDRGEHESVMRDRAGRPRLWRKREPGLYEACPNTAHYQRNLLHQAEDMMANMRLAGLYLDQFGAYRNPCFSADHGHRPGGGAWQFHALHTFARQMKTVLRRVEPDAITTGEAAADAFIDVLDGSLMHQDTDEGLIPLLPAVYAGYWVWFGRSVDRGLREPRAFRFALGNQFVYGGKLGRLSVGRSRSLDNPDLADEWALLARLVQLRQAARDYLQLGRMLRPPVLSRGVPLLAARIAPPGRRRAARTIRQRAIMASAWQAPDGSRAVVLFNTSEGDQPFEFSVDERDLPDGDRVAVSRLVPRGPDRHEGVMQRERVVVRGTLAADEARIYVVRGVDAGSRANSSSMP